MKVLKTVLAAILMCGALLAQQQPPREGWKDLGMGAFSNDNRDILMAVDASLVDLEIKSPYIAFIVYMAPFKQNQDITIGRDNLVMIYQGQEYKMPSIQELRKAYKGEIRDINMYRHLGKEGIIASWIRFYDFPRRSDFFPPLTMGAPLPIDEGSMYNFIGFKTKAYFKNPGLKKGDKVTIKAWDKTHSEISGECDVIIK